MQSAAKRLTADYKNLSVKIVIFPDIPWDSVKNQLYGFSGAIAHNKEQNLFALPPRKVLTIVSAAFLHSKSSSAISQSFLTLLFETSLGLLFFQSQPFCFYSFAVEKPF
jgi:hypothetical protein